MKGKGSRRLLVASAAAIFVLSACGGGDEDATTNGGATEGAGGQAATSLVITADTVTGPSNIPEEKRATQVCVLASRFPRNSEIVWRARVVDPATGEELDDSAMSSVQVQLPDGQTFDMRYGPHPQDDPTDFFWTTSFDVPTDYPTGALRYQIVASSADGRSGTFVPFDVAPSLLTITDEVLETIPEE